MHPRICSLLIPPPDSVLTVSSIECCCLPMTGLALSPWATATHTNLSATPPPLSPPKCSYRADGATLGQLSKALGGKAAPSDAPQDLLATDTTP